MLPNALLRYIRYTHAQTCDCVPVQSATQGAASLHTLHKPISCDNVPVQSAQQCTASVHTQYFTHAQACDNVRVQSATQCTVSVNIILDTSPNLLFVYFFLGQIFFASAVLRTSASIILLWHRKGTQRPSQSITFDQTHWGRDVSHVGLAGQKCLVLPLCVCRRIG